MSATVQVQLLSILYIQMPALYIVKAGFGQNLAAAQECNIVQVLREEDASSVERFVSITLVIPLRNIGHKFEV